MPEIESGPPPEVRDWHAPSDEPEQPAADARPAESAESPAEADDADNEIPSPKGGEENGDAEGASDPEMQGEPSASEDPEVREEMQRLEQEVRAGLATLHGLLQLDPNMRAGRAPEKNQFNNLIDASGKLTELFPASRKELHDALRHEKDFRNADLPTFTLRAMDILALWMQAELMKEALDQSLDERRQAKPAVPSGQEAIGASTAPTEADDGGDGNIARSISDGTRNANTESP